MGQSAVEDTATAAVAAWMVAGRADAATVVLFTSASRYVRALGVRDSKDNVRITVEFGSESIASLYSPERIAGPGYSPSMVESHVWPDRLAACFVSQGNNAPLDYVADLVAEILSRASSQQAIVPTSEHLKSMAEFAAGAGHEINNPLGSIIGQTQLLLKKEQQTDRQQALAMIGSQAWRIRDMIGDCMLFARPPAPDLQSSELGTLVRKAAIDTLNSLEHSADCLQFDLPAIPLAIEIDSSQIRTLVSHLIRNAVEASLNNETDLKIQIGIETDSNAVILTVRDQGPGVADKELRRHLFDPFFSGRQAGRGIGFGLPVCWQITRNHGGLILQETPDSGGARFVVALPWSR